jgi:hypothetical protein
VVNYLEFFSLPPLTQQPTGSAVGARVRVLLVQIEEPWHQRLALTDRQTVSTVLAQRQDQSAAHRIGVVVVDKGRQLARFHARAQSVNQIAADRRVFVVVFVEVQQRQHLVLAAHR